MKKKLKMLSNLDHLTAKEILAILDNLQRAKEAIKSDNILKENKDLDKFLENINIIEKDLVSIFEKNNIKRIVSLNKNLTLISIKLWQRSKMGILSPAQ